MKGKNPQSSTEEIKEKKKYVYKEYFSYLTWKRTPYKEETINGFAEEYLKWAHTNPEALILSEFPQTLGIPLDTWNSWMADYPFLKRAHLEAKRAIGSRREKLAFMNKANANIFMTSAPHYDYNAPDLTWRELLEQKAALTESSSSRPEVITVEIPSFSRTPEQVAAEIHDKTKKYVKPKYKPRNIEEQHDDE